MISRAQNRTIPFVIMRRIFNNWGISVAVVAAAVAIPALFCYTASTQADGEEAAKHELLYPSVRDGNIKDQPLVIVGVIDRKAPAPAITLDGKEVKNLTVDIAQFDDSWKDYETHFYGFKEGKSIKDLQDKNLFVAKIPMLPAGDRVLTIDGVDYKFKKVSSKDKTVTEAYSHHSPFKVKGTILQFKCEECHKVTEKDGKKIFGFAGTENCKHCHKDLSNHKHDMDALKECNKCHDPHASVISKRLLDTKEKLCVQCHEAREPKAE